MFQLRRSYFRCLRARCEKPQHWYCSFMLPADAGLTPSSNFRKGAWPYRRRFFVSITTHTRMLVTVPRYIHHVGDDKTAVLMYDAGLGPVLGSQEQFHSGKNVINGGLLTISCPHTARWVTARVCRVSEPLCPAQCPTFSRINEQRGDYTPTNAL